MSKTVSIVEIGSLILTKNDKSKQLHSGEYLQGGVLPIVDQGSQLICGYTNDLSKSYDKGLPVVIFGDHTLHTKYIDFNFAIGADGTQVLVPKDSGCDSKYLYYLICRAAELIGTEGYKRHFKILKEFNIDYLERLPEQQKIATILSSVDDVIEKTRAQIDKLKDLKTALMQELLTQGIGHTEFKDSPVGRIPVGWDAYPLSELVTINPRMVTKPNEDTLVSFIRMENVSNDAKLIASTNRPCSEVSKGFTHFSDGDVLFAKITPCMENGKGALVQGLTNGIGFGSTEFHVLRASNTYTTKWVYHLVSGHQFREKAIKHMTGSAGQRRVPADFLKEVFIAFPKSTTEVKQIASILDAIEYQIDALIAKLYSSVNIKKALMQDLLTGKVRVTVTDKEVAVA